MYVYKIPYTAPYTIPYIVPYTVPYTIPYTVAYTIPCHVNVIQPIYTRLFTNSKYTKMILENVQTQAKAFTIDLNETIGRLKHVKPRVSTMTIAFTLDAPIDLNLVTLQFPTPLIQDFIIAVMQSHEALQMKTKGKNFSNSVVFKYNFPPNPSSSKAVKVFCNGSLHLTGFKNIEDALEAADIFATLLELVAGGSGVTDMYNVTTFTIQLINAYYKIPQVSEKHQIIMDEYYTLLSKYTEFYTSYNSDHYAGIMLKTPEFSVMTFYSGSIIISSISTPKQLEQAIIYISTFTDKHIDECITTTILDKTKKRKLDATFDYGKYIILK
jgi:TATA-box binding protein (TBP) (component of TFIID and TFIIIB)